VSEAKGLEVDEDEDYVGINVDVLAAPEGKKAVHCRCADGVNRWVPRSIMFGPDEISIRRHVGQLREIKVMRWYARKQKIPLARNGK
jgi:hypothetical protein